MPLSLILAAALFTGAQAADDSGEAIVLRTKTTQTTYTAYQWNTSRDAEGNPFATWAAEFHSGDLHRLEVEGVRIVANCRTHEGYVFDVKSGETRDDDTIWLEACGIDTADQIVAIDRLPVLAGKNGPLDVIRITGKPWTRYYAVDRNGVIVRSYRLPPNGSPSPCVQSDAVAILPSIPTRNMFTRESLAKSFVPQRYRQVPKGPAQPGLAGKSCG